MFYGVGVILVLALSIYCVVEVVTTDDTAIRNLPKVAWLFLCVLAPLLGSVLWLALGRPTDKPIGIPGSAREPIRPEPPPRGPEDSPDFLRTIDEQRKRLQQWEDDLRRREEELRKRDDESPA